MRPWGGPLASEIDLAIKSLDRFQTRGEKPEGVFEYLFKHLEKTNAQGSINFEAIVALIETLYNFHYKHREKSWNSLRILFNAQSWVENIKDYLIKEKINGQDGEQILIFKPFQNTLDSEFQIPDGLENQYYFRNLLAFLLDSISQEIQGYDNPLKISEKRHLDDTLMRFFKAGEEENISRIYTLNYDRVIPYIFRENDLPIFDGFTNGMSKDLTEATTPNVSKILSDLNCLNYYNLHGSIYWKYAPDITQLNYWFVCTPNEPQMNYFNYAQEESNPHEKFFVSNIVTGYNKLQRTNVPPLNAFSYAFQRDCIEADHLVVIGYSFFDRHINRILQNGVEAAHKKQKRIIITKTSERTSFSDYFSYGQEGYKMLKDFFFNHPS